jgi:hypothetical protein
LLTAIPFRIRIGVTGHRVLENEELLREKVRSVLENDIYDLFDDDSKAKIHQSSTTRVAFSILTPLAEGADRLVAREVLKYPGSRIEVVLPLTKEDYLTDFATEASRVEFEGLFIKARRPITLQQSCSKRHPSSDNPKEARRQAYRNVGVYVVNECDVLIALWDGKDSPKPGGTADIKKYAEKKGRPVIVISTKSPHEISVYKGHGLNGQSIGSIESFNTYRIPDQTRNEYTDNVYAGLFNNDVGTEVGDGAKVLIKTHMIPFYVRASRIAKHNQSIYRSVGTLVYLLSVLAITSVVMGILFHEWTTYAFALEFFLLSAIFLMVVIANGRKTQKKWIETRFLAEQIRAAMFFVACNVEVSPIEVPPYMRTAHHPDDWMVKVFDEIWKSLPEMDRCPESHCRKCAGFIRNQWIKEQIGYHRDKASKVRKISRLLEFGGMVIFSLAMAASLSHLIFLYPGREIGSKVLEQILVFLAIVLPAIGAAIGGIRSLREYSRMEKRSSNMEIILNELDEQFMDINTPEDLELLLRTIYELMLRENQDWLMLMKFVELKPEA